MKNNNVFKNQFRERILFKRKQFYRNDFLIEDGKIYSNLQLLFTKIITKKKFIGVYYPLKGEPNIIKLREENQFLIGLPKMIDEEMLFTKYIQNENSLIRNRIINIFESDSNFIIKPEICIVPALAYSVSGVRLGFGSGYYDKYFAENKHILKIGTCYYDGLYQSLPQDSFDIPMDYIITEEGIIQI